MRVSAPRAWRQARGRDVSKQSPVGDLVRLIHIMSSVAALAVAMTSVTGHARESVVTLSSGLISSTSSILPNRALFREIVRLEARQFALPWELAEAVIYAESGYDPSRIGEAGGVGLFQINQAKAHSFGYLGNAVELNNPRINIQIRVRLLAAAWRLADKDLCLAILKYKEGNDKNVITPRAYAFCKRVNHFLAGSPLALLINHPFGASHKQVRETKVPTPPKLRSADDTREFWEAHDKRIKAIKAAVARRQERIVLNIPSIEPLAHTRFCLSQPDECQTKMLSEDPQQFKLTPDRWTDILSVNNSVNRLIKSNPRTHRLLDEKWTISPKIGKCHDYAVTKRHQLIARGWPPHTLLLAEVETSTKERHMVLVVRGFEVDLVLDNLSAEVRTWAETPYRWLRLQSQNNPRFWLGRPA